MKVSLSTFEKVKVLVGDNKGEEIAVGKEVAVAGCVVEALCSEDGVLTTKVIQNRVAKP